jgi:hypothetical protein
MTVLISSALRDWKNDQEYRTDNDDPSILAWRLVKPENPEIDPAGEGIEGDYAFHLGFGMALQLGTRMVQQPFSDVKDIVKSTAETAASDLEASVENREGRRRGEPQ